MFLEEARIASSINHPNVCRVLDFGQAEGTYYPGHGVRARRDLGHRALSASPPSVREPVRLHALSTYVIAPGLRGPARRSRSGRSERASRCRSCTATSRLKTCSWPTTAACACWIFGIASTGASNERRASTTQVIKGRYAYMAPEQTRGIDVDRRADIWSLGVCLREALGGERLFERDTQVATILAVTKEDLPSWPRQVPLLLREIWWIVPPA